MKPYGHAGRKHASSKETEKKKSEQAVASVYSSGENIVLTGMPGSGKSTVGRLLDLEGFDFIDTDEEIERRCGCPIRELIKNKGEAYFRDLETEVIRDVSSGCFRIISTGGGAVLREENVRNLKKNGRLFFLNADISRLQVSGDRPLSDTRDKLEKMYEARIAIYRETADVIVPDMATPQAEAEFIKTEREKR